MKLRSLPTLALVAVTYFTLSGSTFAADTESVKAAAPTAESDDLAAKEETGKSKLVLAKGLEADAILKGYGKPSEIKPMEAPDKETKVEQWIYRRKLKQVTTQKADGQTMVPTYSGFSGPGSSVTETAVPTYRTVHVTIYQVTALLMVNGKLEFAKQWAEEQEAE